MDINSSRLYKNIIDGDLDMSSVGFFSSLTDRTHRYYCTPKNAQIIGALRVDGIHYCVIPYLGNTIYIVSPMPLGEHHVVPIAENFSIFLYLISCFWGTQLLDQVPYLTKVELENIVGKLEEEASVKKKAIIERLKEETKNVLLPDDVSPYEYIIELYNNYEYNNIEYTNKYYKTIE